MDLHETIRRTVSEAYPGRRVEVIEAYGVGLAPGSIRVLFHSADDFAEAWAKSGLDDVFSSRELVQVYLKEFAAAEYDDDGAFVQFVPCLAAELGSPV